MSLERVASRSIELISTSGRPEMLDHVEFVYVLSSSVLLASMSDVTKSLNSFPPLCLPPAAFALETTNRRYLSRYKILRRTAACPTWVVWRT